MITVVLKNLGCFSEREVELFKNEVKIRHVQKNEILLNQGEVASSVFFSLKGCFYQHQSSRENDLRVIDLHSEGEWILNHESFVTQCSANSFISAYTEGCVLEISMVSIHYLIGCSLAFLQMNKIMGNAVSRMHFFDHALNPLEKYQYIITHSPQLLQSFPLKMLASYLKVAPETLSRVREKIVKK